MSEEIKTTKWSIGRFKGRTDRGRCYPIRLEYAEPVSAATVLLYCLTEKRFGNSDFKSFNHFEIHPTLKL